MARPAMLCFVLVDVLLPCEHWVFVFDDLLFAGSRGTHSTTALSPTWIGCKHLWISIHGKILGHCSAMGETAKMQRTLSVYSCSQSTQTNTTAKPSNPWAVSLPRKMQTESLPCLWEQVRLLRTRVGTPCLWRLKLGERWLRLQMKLRCHRQWTMIWWIWVGRCWWFGNWTGEGSVFEKSSVTDPLSKVF